MPFKKYSTALRERTLKWLSRIKEVDILVGIPTYNNEDTVGYVITQAGVGLHRYYRDLKTAIFVSDGGSTDNTRENALVAEVPSTVEKHVEIYRGIPGKGTSFRAIFEAAVSLNARAILVMDSDLRSITPEWIKFMGEPVLKDGYDFLWPFYKRHKFDGTITNMIVYPMTRAVFFKDIRQPIGGDFSFTRRMAELFISRDVWDTDVAKFGIDIWMTSIAIHEARKYAQVYLGTKVHNAKDPAQDLSAMFTQVVSTLFYMIGEYKEAWMKKQETEPVPILPTEAREKPLEDIRVSVEKMELEFMEGFKHFEPFYKAILSARAFEGLSQSYLERASGDPLRFPPQLWARIIYDFAATYQTWSRNRRRLVNIMVPLYFGRTAAYSREVMDKPWEEAEKLIQQQASIFEEHRDYFKGKFSKKLVDSGILF